MPKRKQLFFFHFKIWKKAVKGRDGIMHIFHVFMWIFCFDWSKMDVSLSILSVLGSYFKSQIKISCICLQCFNKVNIFCTVEMWLNALQESKIFSQCLIRKYSKYCPLNAHLSECSQRLQAFIIYKVYQDLCSVHQWLFFLSYPS